ncbi:MAG: hypothetical protein F9K45_07295 [Melioribacteraceae bacterium]|nr:MAG: hypothetical protein F9K45_07295 [Melioribacteraceae bacterium]
MLFISFGAYAQSMVSGVVRDAESGDVLIGATIQVEGKNIGTSTNEKGLFGLNNLLEKVVELRISYVGYHALDIAVETGKKEEVEINLYRMDILTKQIVVTANRNEQMIGDIAGRVELISTRTISSTPKLSTDDLFKGSSAVLVDRSSGIFSHAAVVNV